MFHPFFPPCERTRIVIAVPLKVGILRQACDPEANSGDARRGQPVV